MPKLTLDNFPDFQQDIRRKLWEMNQRMKAKVIVHTGTCGLASGAQQVYDTIEAELQRQGTTDVLLTTSGCAGLCSKEPMATVLYGDGPPVKYAQLTAEKVLQIVSEHLLRGKVVAEYALAAGQENSYES